MPADLDALEALLAKTTPGEWEATTYSNYAGWSIYAHGAGCIAERWYATGQQDEIPRNDLLIAALHNAAPALIAELRALREANRWRPIAEAPRESEERIAARIEPRCPRLLVWVGGELDIAYYDLYYSDGGAGFTGGSGWVGSSGEEIAEPTHFLVLPDPPEGA